jgi:hypothetical protein
LKRWKPLEAAFATPVMTTFTILTSDVNRVVTLSAHEDACYSCLKTLTIDAKRLETRANRVVAKRQDLGCHFVRHSSFSLIKKLQPSILLLFSLLFRHQHKWLLQESQASAFAVPHRRPLSARRCGPVLHPEWLLYRPLLSQQCCNRCVQKISAM